MDDEKIIALYWQRKETAVRETKIKYGRYCYSIAQNILGDREDAEECENDTYLDAWKSMPPAKPRVLSVFLGTITRRIALDRWRCRTAAKRGNGESVLSLCELEECIPAEQTIGDRLDTAQLAEHISVFLRALPEAESNVFLRRYWYCDSVDAICHRYGFGKSKVKMMLLRTREKLRAHLEKEEIFI